MILSYPQDRTGALTLTNTPRIARVQTNIVALMVAFSVMSYFDRIIMSIAAPGIMREFSLTETEMGAVFTSFLLSYALMMIPGGGLADRFGPRRVLTAMGLGAALFTGLTALGGRPGLGSLIGIVPAFVAIRFGLGIFTAPLYPSCARANANWFPLSRRARVWGLVAAGAGLGGAVSPFLFARMAERFGWRWAFAQAAVATGALALVWAWYARDRPFEVLALGGDERPGAGRAQALDPPPAKSATRWRALLTNRNLLLLTVGYSTVGYFEYIYFYWIYYYFGEIRRFPARTTEGATALIFLSWMVLSPLGGWVSDRLVARYGARRGRRSVPVACLTLSALLLVVGINLTGTAATVTCLALSLGLASCSDGPFWASAIDIAGRDVGAATGILNTGANLAGGLAPYVTAVIASRADWSAGLYFGSLVLLAGVLTWFFFDPSRTIPGGSAEA